MGEKNLLSGLILTGGQGTRLRPLTLHCPKPLLPIANQPFLSCQLEWLRRHAVRDVTLCIAEQESPYRSLIRSESRRKTILHCSREKKPLGTAGALKNAEKFLRSDTVFIFNGDILTDIDLTQMLAFHRRNQSKITVALIAVQDPSMFGLAVMDRKNHITHFLEKPLLDSLPKQKFYLVNAGTYLFDRSIFSRIPAGENYSVEKQLFPDCLQNKIPMFGFAAGLKTYWLDIGTPDKYRRGNADLILGRAMKNLSSRWRKIGAGSQIAATAQIDDETAIGKNCIIKSGCTLKESVILDGARIGENCAIEQSLVGKNARLGDHCILRPGSAVADDSVLGAYSKL